MHSSKINFFIQSIHVTRTTFRVYIRTTAQTNRSIPFWAVFRRLSPWKSLNDESIYKTANVGVNVTRRTESLRSPNREKGGESFWLAWSGRAKEEEEEEENKRRRDGCSGARVTRRVFSCTLLSRKGSREGDEVERRSVPATRNERRQWRRTGRRSGTRMRLEKRRDATPSSLSLSLQFNFSAFPLGKTFIPTGKPIPAPLQVCETWPQPASFPLEYFSPRRRSSSR